ncbi:galactose mutarotase-like domain-containing protein, partial [Mycena epipterygia]
PRRPMGPVEPGGSSVFTRVNNRCALRWGMCSCSNNFLHSTFSWVGIDGTQVLCHIHMTPVDTNTVQATVCDVDRAVDNEPNLMPMHRRTESSDASLSILGNGNGGGGPLPKMLAKLRRIRPVTNTHQGVPPVNLGHSVDEFFDYLASRTKAERTLPNWRRELYLELKMRKGLTGMWDDVASIKKGNRHSEIFFRDVEHVSTLASLSGSKTYLYPKQMINDSWEKVLLNEFLPGSSMIVYDDAEKLCAKMIDDALDRLVGATALEQVVAYKTFLARREVVRLPLAPGASALKAQVAQVSADGREGHAVVHCVGFMPVSVYTIESDHFALRNSSVQLTISTGRITSLGDEGATDGLVIFEDWPNVWDAWDAEIHHLEKATQLEFSNVSVGAQGLLRASVRAEVEYGQSKIGVNRHEFQVYAVVLRRISCRSISIDNATYEPQFGHVRRPTHKNTTWDMAEFEVCGHKYTDLSKYGYSYGFACQGNILRISLLRAATEPDAEQDQGVHTFSWAVVSHKGHFLESDVLTAAYLFNSPLYIRLPALLITLPPLILPRGSALPRSRRAGTGERTVVLRLYEAFSGHAQVQLRIVDGLGVEAAYVTNLLEDAEDTELALVRFDGVVAGVGAAKGNGKGTGLELTFRGFEVQTVKLVLGSGRKTKSEKRDRYSWVTVDA